MWRWRWSKKRLNPTLSLRLCLTTAFFFLTPPVTLRLKPSDGNGRWTAEWAAYALGNCCADVGWDWEAGSVCFCGLVLWQHNTGAVFQSNLLVLFESDLFYFLLKVKTFKAASTCVTRPTTFGVLKCCHNVSKSLLIKFQTWLIHFFINVSLNSQFYYQSQNILSY